jgi:hypothetical protein
MKMKYLSLLVLIAGVISLSSCKSDYEIKQTAVTLTNSSIAGVENPSITNLVYSFKNVSTGKVVTSTELQKSSTGSQYSLPEGLYNISAEGDITYTDSGKTLTAKVKGYKESVQFTGESAAVALDLFLYYDNAGFVISEVQFAGTKTPEGKAYLGDQYIKIYNNSDSVLYADGLLILESQYTTTSKYDYTPDVISQAMTVAAIYAVPGSGKEHPVNPGESLLISDRAIDHTQINTNSYNLSKSDFEWYDVSSVASQQDTDNPAVPNLDKIYCYTKSYWNLNNQGTKSYAIARLDKSVDKASFLANYKYDGTYVNHLPTGDYTIAVSAYKIPNSWIIDAVNVSIKSTFQWIVTDPSLDLGWTYCSEVAADVNRYGKSVRRKVLSTTPDGRQILKDSNNSTIDFEAEAVPSLKK